MGKIFRRTSNAGRKKPPEKRAFRFPWWAYSALLLFVAAALYALRDPTSTDRNPRAQGGPDHQNQRFFYEDPEAAKPFPATLEPSRFGTSIVSVAYRIARQIPEVLVQQPCHCNCGVLGHRSLLDCYVSYHAATCAACLQEAILAQQMTAAGKTPNEIREAIEQGLFRSVNLDPSAPGLGTR